MELFKNDLTLGVDLSVTEAGIDDDIEQGVEAEVEIPAGYTSVECRVLL